MSEPNLANNKLKAFRERRANQGFIQVNIWLKKEERDFVDSVMAEEGLKSRSELISAALRNLKETRQAK